MSLTLNGAPISELTRTEILAAFGLTDAEAQAKLARFGVGFESWAQLGAETGMVDGTLTTVDVSDTGTHDSVTGDVGAEGGQTPNSGRFAYSVSVEDWVRTGPLDSALAKEQVALAAAEADKLADYRPVRVIKDTRALAQAALDAGEFTDDTDVYIRTDEAYDNKFTLNFVRAGGGWDMVYVKTLPFTPQEVFANRKGAFYLPAKRSGLYQDRAFASPVSASGQNIAAMVDRSKERPDPTVERRNLLSRTDNMAPSSVWTYERLTVKQRFEYPTVGNARLARLEETAQSGTHAWSGAKVLTAGPYSVAVEAQKDQVTVLRLQFDNGYADFDLNAGTVSGTTGGLTSADIELNEESGTYRCEVKKTVAAGTRVFAVFLVRGGTTSYVGTVGEGLYMGLPQLEAGDATEYQPVQEDSLGWMGENIMVAPTDANRPTYIEEDGIGRARFNGVDQFMRCAAFDLLNAEKATTVVALVRSVGTGLTQVWLHHGAGGTSSNGSSGYGSRSFFLNLTAVGRVAAGYGDFGSFQTGLPVHAYAAPEDRLLAFTLDPQDADQKVTANVDGRLCPIDLSDKSTFSAAEGAHGMGALTFGGQRAANDNMSLRAEFDLFGAFIVAGKLSEAEIFAQMQYLIEQTGIAPDFPSYIATKRDNLWDSKIGTYAYPRWRVSPMSRLVFDTEATELTLHLWNDLAAYPNYRHVEVNVNGEFFAQVSPGAANAFSTHILANLPFGAKRVEVINGLQSGSAGTYVLGVGSNKTLTPVPQEFDETVHAFVDSIGVGDRATNPIREGGFMLARAAAPVGTRLLVDGYGVNSWFDQVGDSTKRAAAVARVVASGATKFYGQLSVNDFNFRDSYWGGSAAAMATAVGLFLDALVAEVPDIEAILQTMLPTTVAGDQAAWRAAIAGLATGRDFVTIADGTNMGVTTADTVDGVHLDTEGQFNWAKSGSGLIATLGWA